MNQDEAERLIAERFKKARLIGTIAGLIVILFGYVAMRLMYEFSHEVREVSGFHDSLGGSVGDLVLPFIIGSMVTACYTLDTSRNPSLVALAGAIFGSTLGAATQLAWVSDPNVRPDWVIPEPHTLSTAGWYHAFYLITLSGLIGGLALEVLVRARKATTSQTIQEHPFARIFHGDRLAIFLALPLIFSFTVVIDSLRAPDTASSQATLALVSAPSLLFTAILGAVSTGCRQRFLFATFGGLLLAGTVAWGLVKSPEILSGEARWLFLAQVAVGISIYWVNRHSLRWRHEFPLAVTFGTIPVLLALTAITTTALGAAIAWVAFGIGYLLFYKRSSRFLPPPSRQTLSAEIISSCTLGVVGSLLLFLASSRTETLSAGGLSENPLAATTTLITFIFVVPAGHYSFLFVKHAWKYMSWAEKTASANSVRGPELGLLTVRTWTIAILVAYADIFTIFPFLAQMSGISVLFSNVSPDLFFDDVMYPVLVVAILATLALPALIVITREGSTQPENAPILRPRNLLIIGLLGAGCLLAVGAAFIELAPGVWSKGGEYHFEWSNSYIFLVGIFYGAHVLVTLLGNVRLVCWTYPTLWDYLLFSLVGALCAGLLIRGLLIATTAPYARTLVGVFVVIAFLMAAWGISLMVGCLVHLASRSTSGSIWPISWTLTQDELTRSLIVVATAWVPVFLFFPPLSGANRETLTLLEWTSLSAIAVSVSLIVVPIIEFGLWQWARHASEQRQNRFKGAYSNGETSLPNRLLPVTREALHLIRQGGSAYRPRRRSARRMTEEEWLTSLGAHLGLMILATLLLAVATVVNVIGALLMSRPPSDLSRTSPSLPIAPEISPQIDEKAEL